MPEGMRWVGLDVHARGQACVLVGRTRDPGEEDG
jgi:hypothetical protein